MENFKKYLAEFIGTFILVFLGCGTAMTVGADKQNNLGGYVIVAFAFGLAIVALAYSVGNISGGHVNPAVSVAVFINGGLTVTQLIGYIVAQCLGAFAASGLLAGIFNLGQIADKTGGYGTNSYGPVNNAGAGFLIEMVLTCIFVMTILGVTSSKQKHGSFGGLVIGYTLVAIHLISIGLTGCSVNPARSFGPALVAAINGMSGPMAELWVFICGPLVGAIIAAVVYKFLESDSDSKKAKSSK